MKAKREEGNKYGRLTVLSRLPNHNRWARWLCQCECGKQTQVLGSCLRRGTIRSCGCLRTDWAADHSGASPVQEMVGRIFGYLTVLDRAAKKPGSRVKGAAWRCVCRCGAMRVIPGVRLRDGTTRSCGCMNRLPDGLAAFRAVYSTAKLRARMAGRRWNINPDEFRVLIAGNCSFCGTSPATLTSYQTRGKLLYNPVTLSDRESPEGFSSANVDTCCALCARRKARRSSGPFVQSMLHEFSVSGEVDERAASVAKHQLSTAAYNKILAACQGNAITADNL